MQQGENPSPGPGRREASARRMVRRAGVARRSARRVLGRRAVGRRVAALAGASAVALAGLGLGAGTAAAGQPPSGAAGAAAAGAQRPDAGSLDWGKCPDLGALEGTPQAAALQCATLTVPLDYDKPNGKTIELAISRLRSTAPDERRGVLLVNPGGPGGSGLPMPLQLAALGAPASLLDRYDLIGFDPRGVGHSSPVYCHFSASQLQKELPPYPEGPREVSAYEPVARGLGRQCAQSPDGPGPQINTANTARDMDRIRRALGEPKISYFGVSYGTYLGAVYASLFPERTDRVILDSSVGPDMVWHQEFRAWGASMELRFPDFAKWAAARDGTYELGQTPGQVRHTYFELAKRLDDSPVGPYNGSTFRQVTFNAMYGDESFPGLAQLWQALERSDQRAAVAAARKAGLAPGQRANQEAGQKRSAAEPPAALDNRASAQLGVVCNDAEWPSSMKRYQRDVARDRERFPMLGAMAAMPWACAFWPNAPEEPPVSITDDGPSNILILQNLRDPATIYAGGVDMRRALGDRARLVTVNQGGHGVYLFTQNACANNAATRFLVDGKRPATDTYCPAKTFDRASKLATPRRQEALQQLRQIQRR